MSAEEDMFDNACRLCDEGGSSMHSIFERVSEDQQILQLIRDCLRLPIYRTDPLPKRVCDSCYMNLVEFAEFKRTALETLEKQKKKLREDCRGKNVQLYLSALEEESRDGLCNSHEDNNSEISIRLRTDIYYSSEDKVQSDCLGQQDLTNGHLEDEDSLASKERNEAGSPSSISQNAESQSEVDMGDSDTEQSLRIMTAKITGKRLRSEDDSEGPSPKKRRFMGPKSRVTQRMERYMEKLSNEKLCKKEVLVKYNPLSLLRCVLNYINKENVPNYKCDSFEKIELNRYMLATNSGVEELVLDEENICSTCDRVFLNVNKLAVHESEHMFVVLGEKVDTPRMWHKYENNSRTRNLWWNSINNNYKQKRIAKVVENFDDSTGHVNVFDPEDVSFLEDEEEGNEEPVDSGESGVKGEIELVDGQAYINGVLLSDHSKDDRRSLYRTVTVNGVKRKFCHLCRYTFKDNWAIESHYFSTACYYTCRFCGIRFNKQRNEFDDHVEQHEQAGDTFTTKIFASRKFHSVPKVINEKKVNIKPLPPPEMPVTRRIKPLKMKQLFERQVEIKQEPDSDSYSEHEGTRGDGKQNQAYFCRKCYQVFFRLDEFNVHVVSCNGTAFKSTKATYNGPPKPLKPFARTKNEYTEPEKFSPTGRPMRNCVKEIGTYADDGEDMEVRAHIKKLSTIKSPRGFECTLCSSCFPTVHSRNSHMRIHKDALHQMNKKSITIQKPTYDSVARRVSNMVQRNVRNISPYRKYANNVKIKQEPMEPIVEIHEQPHNNFINSLGAVSITPIPNSSHKTSLDPSIMKLVQSNPNLTIKTMNDFRGPYGNKNYNNYSNNSNNSSSSSSNAGGSSLQDESKCYRCLSCSKPFSNKSNLYFHKKNQCSGSKYPCPFCKKRFGTEAAYSSHIFYNHPE